MFETYDSGFYNQIDTVKRKTNGFIKLMRPENLIPASLLCFTGGFIINPQFLIATYSISSFLDSVIIDSK
jgi:hypothetical protein